MEQRNVAQEIENLIKKNNIVLFMKGNPTQPACGFSARAVMILKAQGFPPDTYCHVDVLKDEDVRQAIKEYSSWPTIPQLYINGVFIGGSDIMMEMHEDGELEKLLRF